MSRHRLIRHRFAIEVPCNLRPRYLRFNGGHHDDRGLRRREAIDFKRPPRHFEPENYIGMTSKRKAGPALTGERRGKGLAQPRACALPEKGDQLSLRCPRGLRCQRGSATLRRCVAGTLNSSRQVMESLQKKIFGSSACQSRISRALLIFSLSINCAACNRVWGAGPGVVPNRSWYPSL